MRKKAKRITGVAIGLACIALLAACSALDVVGKDSIRAFHKVLRVLPAQGSAQKGWVVTAPDGEACLGIYNDVVSMEVKAKPFVEAGLDLGKLDNSLDNVTEDSLVFFSAGFDMLGENIKDSAAAQFEAAASFLRSDIGYHTPMDHYNLSFGGGNMFEWAKNMKTNGTTSEIQDKDIVFVLNPEPFLAAGVDPEKIEGWVYKQVAVEENGKTEQVWKFLKPFDLE